MILSRLAGANRSGSNLFIRKVIVISIVNDYEEVIVISIIMIVISIVIWIVNDYEEGAAGTSKGLSKRQGHGANSRLQQELRCPDDSVVCPDNSVGKVGSYYSNVFIIFIIVTILMIIIIIIIIIPS